MTDAGSGHSLEATGPQIRLYGFADFTYSSILNPDTAAQQFKWNTFSVGNVNLYVDSQISEKLHSLVEVRFMYLPNGTQTGINPETYLPDGKPVARTNTIVADYTDIDRPIQWGGISLQRAYVERTMHKLLTVRVGHFLTPYGIWNVDHGSPVFIGIRRPFIVGQQLFPASQTGLECYGTFDVDATQFGYHLTLSNGRGPISNYRDLDNNKAIGGRVFARNESSLGTLTLGLSGYRGTFTNRDPQAGLMGNVEVLSAQYRELSLGADVKWERRGALVQAETILHDIGYTESMRPIDPGYMGGPPGFTPDHRIWGFYALAGYRTPFLGIMPFFSTEYVSNLPGNPGAWAALGGLNIRPEGNLVLKAQVLHVWFTEAAFTLPAKQMLDLQAAWSF